MGIESTRRRVLQSLGLWMAGSPLLQAQSAEPRPMSEPPGRITPREEVLHALEFEEMARRSLPLRLAAKITGQEDRKPFDRIVLHPRVMVDVHKLDLTLDLLGTKMYAPILVGPASNQRRFHDEGELAVVRGAAAAQAAAVISSRSSYPIEKIAAETDAALWYQVYPEADMTPVLARLRQAVQAGCRAVCITIGTPYRPAAPGSSSPLELAPVASPQVDWAIVDQVRQAAAVPVLLKGVMSPEEAQASVEQGVNGIVISGQGRRFVHGMASAIDVLPSVADAVGGKIPVLIDGGFRRGTDVISALALGARAVLVTRPVLWGLASYGDEGVQTVLEMLQTESARTMGLCGKPNLAALDRTLVRLDRFAM